jgi:hypothetical protein
MLIGDGFDANLQLLGEWRNVYFGKDQGSSIKLNSFARTGGHPEAKYFRSKINQGRVTAR